MNTKGLNAEGIEKYTKMLNMEHKEGRTELAPEVHKMLHDTNCNRFNSTGKFVAKKTRNKNKQNDKNEKSIRFLSDSIG